MATLVTRLVLLGLAAAVVAQAAIQDRSSSASLSASRSTMSRSLALNAKAKLGGTSSVVSITSENFEERVAKNTEQFVVILFHAPWSSRSNKFMTSFIDVAEELGNADNTTVFAIVDITEDPKLGREFMVHNFPTVKMVTRGMWGNAGTYSPYVFSKDELERYVKHIQLHEKFKYLKGKQIEENTLTHPSQGSVVELNYTTFENYTKSFKFFTFAAFYAPWCSACKDFQPELEAAATYFKDDPWVIVARVNSDEHPKLVERYSITGLPTCIMFPKARLAKLGIRFQGDPERHDVQASIDTQNRMGDNEDMPYIDENTDLEELQATEKATGKDPQSLLEKLQTGLKKGNE